MLRPRLRPVLREFARTAVLLCTAAALLMYPEPCMQTVRQGLALCAQTIVPSLFPFLVLSGMVVELGMANHLGRMLEGIMWPLFRINGAGATALVLGLVGGYPVGARTAVELYQTGQCSRRQTERLLAFCNNAGPAFIFGVVGTGVFGSSWAGVVLYGIHIAACLCVGLLFRFYGAGETRTPSDRTKAIHAVRVPAAFTGSVRAALTGVLNICAFVVTFGVLIRLLDVTGVLGGAVRLLSWFGMDVQAAKQLLTGLLEVSSGVVGLEGEGRLTMAALMLGWAGLCVHCQVLCFLADSGLQANTYLVGKALHGALSALFAAGLARLAPQVLPAGSWLGQPIEHAAAFSFLPNIAWSVAVAWLVWMVFLMIVAGREEKAKKRGGKGRTVAV